jgi:DNA-binding response OmpR family regulator
MVQQTVLILSADPVIGALLGVYVELFEYRATYAEVSQSGDDAVARSKPDIILVDLEHPDGASRSFVDRQRAGARSVVAFSSRAAEDEVARDAAGLGVPFFAMPIDSTTFRVVLDRASRSSRPPLS